MFQTKIEKKTIIMISTLLCLAGLLIIGLIIPLISETTKLQKDTSALRFYLEKRYQRSKRLRTSTQKINTLKAAAGLYPGHLFHPGEELALITALERVAAKNSVAQTIGNSNLDKISNQQIEIHLSVTGRYRAVLNYLADLEALPYFLVIQQLALAPDTSRTAADRPDQVTLGLNLNLYVAE